MKLGLPISVGPFALALGAFTVWSNSAIAQVRMYDVQWTNTAPTIDGVIGAGEWAAAGPEQGNWGDLRNPETDMDTANNRMQMMWDANGLYFLHRSNQTVWQPPGPEPNPDINFALDTLNIYLDPNADDEPNFVSNPDDIVDGYQVAFSQLEGTFISTNANRQGIGFFTEAHIDTLFGDNGNWNRGGSQIAGAAMQGMIVGQNNGANGALSEIFIPWSNFNADVTNPTGDYNRKSVVDAADYVLWRKTLTQTVDPAGSGADGDGDGTVDEEDYGVWRTAFGAEGSVGTSGLYHPMAPSNDDTWFLQMGEIYNPDPDNLLPVFNWTSSTFFAAHPHAEITFVGRPAAGLGTAVPEPASVALLTLAALGLVALVRHK
jgi:hypothetical protein